MIAMWWEDISEYILTRTLEFMLEPLDQPVNLLLYQELQQDVCTEWHKAHYALKSAMLRTGRRWALQTTTRSPKVCGTLLVCILINFTTFIGIRALNINQGSNSWIIHGTVIILSYNLLFNMSRKFTLYI